MSAYTKGKWEAKKGAGWFISRVDAKGRRDAVAVGMTPATTLVCGPDCWFNDEEAKANAYLMAAAPELLKDAQSTDQGYDWLLSQLTDFRLYQGSWSLENGDNWAASLVAHIKSRQIGTKCVIAKSQINTCTHTSDWWKSMTPCMNCGAAYSDEDSESIAKAEGK